MKNVKIKKGSGSGRGLTTTVKSTYQSSIRVGVHCIGARLNLNIHVQQRRVRRNMSDNFTGCDTDTQRGDHDFCLSRSHYNDTYPKQYGVGNLGGDRTYDPLTIARVLDRLSYCNFPPPSPPPPHTHTWYWRVCLRHYVQLQ